MSDAEGTHVALWRASVVMTSDPYVTLKFDDDAEALPVKDIRVIVVPVDDGAQTNANRRAGWPTAERKADGSIVYEWVGDEKAELRQLIMRMPDVALAELARMEQEATERRS